MGVEIFYGNPNDVRKSINSWFEKMRNEGFSIVIHNTSSALDNGMAIVTMAYSASKMNNRTGP
ncbi:MAG: hypothetical protein WC725_00570 [Patescibacteria group bacterium]|jgi:hypothetical protein